jgi:hypothetical protein
VSVRYVAVTPAQAELLRPVLTATGAEAHLLLAIDDLDLAAVRDEVEVRTATTPRHLAYTNLLLALNHATPHPEGPTS